MLVLYEGASYSMMALLFLITSTVLAQKTVSLIALVEVHMEILMIVCILQWHTVKVLMLTHNTFTIHL